MKVLVTDGRFGGWGLGSGEKGYLSSGIMEHRSEEAKSYSLSQGGLSLACAGGGWGLLGKAPPTACTVVLC